jgi:hypothetical protein
MPRPKPGLAVPDNRDLFGGATDAETIERVRRGCVAVDWGDR